MAKRSREDVEDGVPVASTSGATVGQQTSFIKNKQVRSETYSKLKHKAKKAKKQDRLKRRKEEEKAIQLGLEPPPRKLQKTIENTREKDETMVQPDDEEVAADEDEDEFAEHFRNGKQASQDPSAYHLASNPMACLMRTELVPQYRR